MPEPFEMPNLYKEIFGEKPRKKRVRLTPGERIKIWEHPEIYGRTCSICGKKITKLSDLQLDHTRPYSKGGTKLNLAHADCNRIKASRNLKYVQKRLGFRTSKKKRRRKTKTKKKKPSSILGLPKIKFPKGVL
jgi:5-methylcytosine-specific restriction endonuclease McrA